ncbi:MAG: response regulator [Bdellovibrionota bacterium]
MKVLVVEDDTSVRNTLGMVLESFEHKADLVEDAECALEYLQSTWPDVLLLDLSLPKMSGEELFEQILIKYGRVTPTVVITAVQDWFKSM